MENIYYLLIVCLVFWYFVHLRRIAEFARKHANHYCKSERLQFISIARSSSRLRFDKENGLYWFSIFELEFSGDGNSKYNGNMSLIGYKLDSINLPTYRI